ncbi:DnaT-like ssDNA-binding domain-containing protein [Brenneria uluponensis]|uniref:DnaT-like ssDNA-binding domain-containing protein n=1 Tax=Brenneria uluponensis TaxID=3057057 RepID=UPI0028ED15A8|nr:DnaT-like ssDNA-binding domain-containing protein [Brenneria ulupoensis]
MAGDWIKMRADLHTHPKVVRIASALNADRLRVIGALHAAWCLFDAHSVDGMLDGYSPKTLDDMIGFPGFADAMIAVGWLDYVDVSLCMPRFSEHNGQSAKRRAQEADRKRNIRKSSAPNADKKRTREEKRREDLKDKPLSIGGDENLSGEVQSETQTPPEPTLPDYLDDIDIPIGKFTMYSGWQPSPDFRKRVALWNRILDGPDPGYTTTDLERFTAFWKADGKVFNHVQWEQKFADSVLYERRQESMRKSIGGSNAGTNQANNSGESTAVQQIRAERERWERERAGNGMGNVGNDGKDLFEPLDHEEWQSAERAVDYSDWEHDQ